MRPETWVQAREKKHDLGRTESLYGLFSFRKAFLGLQIRDSVNSDWSEQLAPFLDKSQSFSDMLPQILKYSRT